MPCVIFRHENFAVRHFLRCGIFVQCGTGGALCSASNGAVRHFVQCVILCGAPFCAVHHRLFNFCTVADRIYFPTQYIFRRNLFSDEIFDRIYFPTRLCSNFEQPVLYLLFCSQSIFRRTESIFRREVIGLCPRLDAIPCRIDQRITQSWGVLHCFSIIY